MKPHPPKTPRASVDPDTGRSKVALTVYLDEADVARIDRLRAENVYEVSRNAVVAGLVRQALKGPKP
jgi:hypothetical protein